MAPHAHRPQPESPRTFPLQATAKLPSLSNFLAKLLEESLEMDRPRECFEFLHVSHSQLAHSCRAQSSVKTPRAANGQCRRASSLRKSLRECQSVRLCYPIHARLR